ncbi:unnamed protein product [Symbiodinium sp. KB8]|nr:unnamed protein product [Symbiodinium sp. KB8]
MSELDPSSSSLSALTVGTYISINFDDGDLTGLLTQASEDDLCDPLYWQFQEVHGAVPRLKVLFPDGSSTFVQASGRTQSETPALIDEDGDEHGFLVVENMPKQVQPSRPPAVPLASRIPAPGGYGFFVRETVDEDYQESRGSPRKKAKRPASRTKPAAGPPKKARLSDGDKTEKASAEAAEGSPAGASGASDYSANVYTEGQKAVPEGEVEGGAVTTGETEGGAAESEKPADESGVGAKARVMVEHAKTPRSVCRSCGGSIEKGSVRCGVQGYAGGRSVLLWAHAACFLEKIRAEYVTARRGRCKATGEAFEVGQIRVGFEVGNHKSWWLPAEAARWTALVVAKLPDAGALASLQGLDDINEEHRRPLLELLQTGKAPETELRRAAKPAARRKAKELAKMSPTASTSPAEGKAPATAEAVADEANSPDEDSDVEVALDAPPARHRNIPVDLDSDD